MTTPLSPPAELTCPRCGEGLSDSAAAQCPSCGTSLSVQVPPPMPVLGGVPTTDTPAPAPTPTGPQEPAPAPCPVCGGQFDADGWCTQCGAARGDARMHFEETPAAWVAGVCDRGIVHPGNEDAMALAVMDDAGRRSALVVCDGVTTARRSAEASLAAADAARVVLTASSSQGIGLDEARAAALETRLVAAADAASEAVAEVTRDAGPAVGPEADAPELGDPAEPKTPAGEPDPDSEPSCTFVAAVVEHDLAVVGSVGDSRAYWIPDEGEARRLTEDDSLAQQAIRDGVPPEVAEHAPGAHTITRWLGVDAPDHTPATTVFHVDRPGLLLLCSDGLWNYASSPDALAATVRSAAPEGAPLIDRARALVAWANGQGGRDNITVALARLGEREMPDPAVETPAATTAPTSPVATPEENTHG